MNMSKFEYSDGAALGDDDAATATIRVTAIAAGSLNDAAMVFSEKKSKAMHVHPTTRVGETKESQAVALKLKHVCDSCSRTCSTLRGLRINVSRWCGGILTQRSLRGPKADSAVKVAKKRAAEALPNQVQVGNTALENVHSFDYLGAKLQ